MAEKRKGYLNINRNDADKHEDLQGLEEAGKHVTNIEELAMIQSEDRI